MNRQSPLYILFFITVITTICGLAVSTVNFATVDMLKKNETLHRNRTISRAFMLRVEGNDTDSYARAVDNEIEFITLPFKGKKIKAMKQKSTGRLGFFFSGAGFWDLITGIVVLTPDGSAIVNIKILEQKETPGLGARIEETAFTDQFKNLFIDRENPEGRYIVIGSSTGDGGKNRVDAITGATQTSLALMKALNSELGRVGSLMKGKEKE